VNEIVADLRASELKARTVPGVTVATAADLGDWAAPIGSIHPRNKQPLGRRLGSGYLLYTYKTGTLGQSMGPIYQSATSGGGPAGALSATVSFEAASVTGGLVLITPQPSGPLSNSSLCPSGVPAQNCAGFMLQSANGTWYAANGTLVGNGQQLLLVADPAVPASVGLNATSSGYAIWPITLLYNSEMVPAYPWRGPVN
jgi:hypothetical protein